MIKAELVTAPNNDLKIANAARVSFDKQSDEFTFRADKPKGSDEGILNFLARDNHFTPFTHVRDTFEISIDEAPLVAINRLNPELITGMVWNTTMTKIRHSLYGWSKLLPFVRWNAAAPIITKLEELYPVASRELGISKDSFVRSASQWEESKSTTDLKVHHYLDEEETDPWFIDITLRETVPIFVARQRFKHMVGFTYNEVSRRYVSDDPEYYYPDEWRKKPDSKKQGSSDEIIDIVPPPFDDEYCPVNKINYWFKSWVEDADFNYKKFLEWEAAPEQARAILPQTMLTSYYVTGSLQAFARAYNLRIDSHAQKEIQDLAKQWDDIIKPKYTFLWNGLTTYQG